MEVRNIPTNSLFYILYYIKKCNVAGVLSIWVDKVRGSIAADQRNHFFDTLLEINKL